MTSACRLMGGVGGVQCACGVLEGWEGEGASRGKAVGVMTPYHIIP